MPIVLWFLFAACLVLPNTAAGASPLRVSGHPAAPPVVWEKQGTLVGIGPALVAEILDSLRLPYEIRPAGSWQAVQDQARQGKIDMIVGLYENDERRTYLDFTRPFLRSPVLVLVARGREFPLRSWRDLTGKQGVAHTGESFGNEFDQVISTHLRVTRLTYEQAFERILDGSADYMVIDIFPAIIYPKLLMISDKVTLLEHPVAIQAYHVGIRKGALPDDVLQRFDEALGEAIRQGRTETLLREQYLAWHETLSQRQRYYAASRAEARARQKDYAESRPERDLDFLMQYLRRDVRYFR